jgi:cellulose synthase operon protein YhjU
MHDDAHSSREQTPANPAITLGGWNLYFIAKFLLLWRGLIGFHPLENLAFAAFLLVPVRSVLWRRVRNVAALPVAAALLWYDSWLPPFSRLWSQASLLTSFSAEYLGELAARFISWPVVALLVLAWAGYGLLARRIRLGVVVVCTLLVLALFQDPKGSLAPNTAGAATAGGGAAEGPDAKLNAALQTFYAKEADRSVTFAPQAGGVPFDVVFIHICSLSWDDLRATGLDSHPLWRRFDLLLTRFNAASSYSGPAAIRIQRATCGQAPHSALYQAAPDRCYLMGSLERSGFAPQMALNHDGHFDDFLTLVQTQGRLNVPPMPLNGLTVAQRAFDDSPIYDDYAVLSRWLDARGKNGGSAALYYNTVSLHDGNRVVGAVGGNSIATYKARLGRLLDDLDRFMQKVESSGRRALVVVVPEHGAALRGDALQVQGLREIPSPAITLVPVGVKVIGPDAHRQGEQVRVDAPTSFLAVSQIVARMIEKSPFGAQPFAAAEYATELSTTDFVAENDAVVLMQQGPGFYLRQGSDGWSEYPGAAAP